VRTLEARFRVTLEESAQMIEATTFRALAIA
jgi:hypothetical protein